MNKLLTALLAGVFALTVNAAFAADAAKAAAPGADVKATVADAKAAGTPVADAAKAAAPGTEVKAATDAAKDKAPVKKAKKARKAKKAATKKAEEAKPAEAAPAAK